MKVWMLSRFYKDPTDGTLPVCLAYSNGHYTPQHPLDVENGWALVLCTSVPHQLRAAQHDSRVQVFRTPYAVVTPELVAAYAGMGAAAGMTLGHALHVLSEHEVGYMTSAYCE